MEKSRVSSKGQTVIPKAVRDALGIEEGANLLWSIEDNSVRVVLRPRDPITALRGILKGTGTSFDELMEDRRKEREEEEAALEREGYGLPPTQ